MYVWPGLETENPVCVAYCLFLEKTALLERQSGGMKPGLLSDIYVVYAGTNTNRCLARKGSRGLLRTRGTWIR